MIVILVILIYLWKMCCSQLNLNLKAELLQWLHRREPSTEMQLWIRKRRSIATSQHNGNTTEILDFPKIKGVHCSF